MGQGGCAVRSSEARDRGGAAPAEFDGAAAITDIEIILVDPQFGVALPAHRPGGLREMEIKTVDGTETGGKSKPE